MKMGPNRCGQKGKSAWAFSWSQRDSLLVFPRINFNWGAAIRARSSLRLKACGWKFLYFCVGVGKWHRGKWVTGGELRKRRSWNWFSCHNAPPLKPFIFFIGFEQKLNSIYVSHTALPILGNWDPAPPWNWPKFPSGPTHRLLATLFKGWQWKSSTQRTQLQHDKHCRQDRKWERSNCQKQIRRGCNPRLQRLHHFDDDDDKDVNMI